MENSNEELLAAIKKGQILLGYLCSKGRVAETDVAIVQTVVSKKQDPESITVAEEAAFWVAYSKLSRMSQPASIESISLARTIESDNPNSIHKKVVLAYRRNGFWAMLIMLLVQIYWVVGASLLSDVTSLPGKIEETTSQIEERRKILGASAADDLKIQFAEAKIDNLYADLEISSHALKEWNILYTGIVWVKGLFQSRKDSLGSVSGASIMAIKLEGSSAVGSSEIEDTKLQFALKYASYVLGAVQTYVLPLLYGFLGAIAYILRNLVKEIKEQSFTREARINYLLRMFLGALAGLAIGWFFGDIQGSATIGVKSLSPLALAFLAGYSVEVLFTVMDKIIDMITKASPGSTASVPK